MNTTNFTHGEEEQEYLTEREAICLYDGGLSEEQAKKLAYACYVHKYRPQFRDYYPLPQAACPVVQS